MQILLLSLVFRFFATDLGKFVFLKEQSRHNCQDSIKWPGWNSGRSRWESFFHPVLFLMSNVYVHALTLSQILFSSRFNVCRPCPEMCSKVRTVFWRRIVKFDLGCGFFLPGGSFSLLCSAMSKCSCKTKVFFVLLKRVLNFRVQWKEEVKKPARFFDIHERKMYLNTLNSVLCVACNVHISESGKIKSKSILFLILSFLTPLGKKRIWNKKFDTDRKRSKNQPDSSTFMSEKCISIYGTVYCVLRVMFTFLSHGKAKASFFCSCHFSPYQERSEDEGEKQEIRYSRRQPREQKNVSAIYSKAHTYKAAAATFVCIPRLNFF